MTDETKHTLNEYERDIRAKYHYLFSKGVGPEVLADILYNCNCLALLDPDNKEKIGEHNIGIMIMAKCGIFGADRMKDLTMRMMGLKKGNANQ